MICFQPYSDLARERGTTRCMGTPTMLGNKNSLLTALSDLQVYLDQCLSWWSFVLSSPLQVGIWLLRHLRPLFHTLAFSRPLWVRWLQSSPIPSGSVLAILSQPALRRVFGDILPLESLKATIPPWDNPSSEYLTDETNTITFLVKCINRFHFSCFTTLQTQVPLVSIDRRVSPIFLFGYRFSDIVGGLHTLGSAATQRMPPDPNIAIQMLPFSATLPPVSGRTGTQTESSGRWLLPGKQARQSCIELVKKGIAVPGTGNRRVSIHQQNRAPAFLRLDEHQGAVARGDAIVPDGWDSCDRAKWRSSGRIGNSWRLRGGDPRWREDGCAAILPLVQLCDEVVGQILAAGVQSTRRKHSGQVQIAVIRWSRNAKEPFMPLC